MSFIQKLGGLVFNHSVVKGIDNADQTTNKVVNDVYENGVIALANNRYEEALNLFKKASALGHVSAKYNAGLMLYNGLGDYNDFELAKKYFQEAKVLGHDKCDGYINFLNLADKCMDISISDEDCDTETMGALCSLAFKKMSISPDKQNGEFVYMAHHYLLRVINGREYLANAFIENEIGTMFINPNDHFTHFLKYKGIYNKGFSEVDYLNNDSLVSNYLDGILFDRVISFSNYKLDYSDLSYSRCCIVNEIMKKFPNKRFM
ncbi:sel1 repeat family protein [Glaesserella parasuis]|uniref:Sel1 repeat family protein n=1 Tax=Glaesserella parasuis HPS10 TaxID=1450514 RepID=A0A836MFK1_GLAPU|nr:sel1 repeat family protein [Glaesserella parasuis]KDB49180.1 hypothetical protein HPS10_00715 [Glaesserella parasuis HPS10]KDD80835.1 hypothetical protein HPS42_06690 [Glaesserella parasuis ST4-2]MCT8563596.1 sel1 repeat family protein [Glaesserella parasuis]MCT8590066.1 sel1 repeat family protein [Glaesserella parasuis]MCT8628601.1 sel1 repeat family protein [Glaesserella parasuis]